jgi:hypothetical protein
LHQRRRRRVVVFDTPIALNVCDADGDIGARNIRRRAAERNVERFVGARLIQGVIRGLDLDNGLSGSGRDFYGSGFALVIRPLGGRVTTGRVVDVDVVEIGLFELNGERGFAAFDNTCP